MLLPLLRSHPLLHLHHAARLSPPSAPRLLLRRAARSPLPPLRARANQPTRMAASSGSNANSPAPSPPPPVAHKSKIRFCPSCGSPTKMAIPDGDEKMRAICSSCGRVHYENPKMVVGCLVEHDNKVLLCRRKIEPAYGLWTLPAGYLEVGESTAEGAARETLEEACADVEIISPFAQLDIPLIGQVAVDFK
ncbi:hypothetical protein PR202_gb23258 [Eleusine coracana subsp. coracana]|uniref:Nudix hydrolase domain-containing protein n=1 Tax=Eleusine coracana subsp. coracana TaxID=191504 RepID=A0AAV5FIH7_ELECO|nr:hypothetical protein PR202_gb23258 [Eleusine coracana subsp. coracana]